MNDAACAVFLNLIHLAVRMMPIFICLEPKKDSRENIAAVSVYLWVIMISLESVFHITHEIFFIFQGVFSCLFFLVLLIFFDGSLLKKAFLYVSAWLFAVVFSSLNEFAPWILRDRGGLSYAQVCVLMYLLCAIGFYVFVRLWLKETVAQLFGQLSTRSCSLLFTYPSVSLFILFVGRNTIFSTYALRNRGLEDVLFFVALCAMILTLFVMILGNTLEIVCRRKTEEELKFARQLIGKQREHYNQTLEYMEQVRIIKHDFRHHIHALLNMEKEEQARYLLSLKRELDQGAEMVFCQNQAVNGLFNEYAAKARQDGIEFSVKADLSAQVPVDDLTLCIVTGNLLENALEACRRFDGERFIRLRARWMGDHLVMMVENSFDGRVRQSGGKLLSSKKDGGLGILSIRRTLNQSGDEFDVDYKGNVFTAMVRVAGRRGGGFRS